MRDEAEDGRQDQLGRVPPFRRDDRLECDGEDLVEYDCVGGCALTDEEPAALRRHGPE